MESRAYERPTGVEDRPTVLWSLTCEIERPMTSPCRREVGVSLRAFTRLVKSPPRVEGSR